MIRFANYFSDLSQTTKRTKHYGTDRVYGDLSCDYHAQSFSICSRLSISWRKRNSILVADLPGRIFQCVASLSDAISRRGSRHVVTHHPTTLATVIISAAAGEIPRGRVESRVERERTRRTKRLDWNEREGRTKRKRKLRAGWTETRRKTNNKRKQKSRRRKRRKRSRRGREREVTKKRVASWW